MPGNETAPDSSFDPTPRTPGLLSRILAGFRSPSGRGVDPIGTALASVLETEPRNAETAVVRGVLAIPGVRGAILLATGPDGDWTVVSAAGENPPTEPEAREAPEPDEAPADATLIAFPVRPWNPFPAWRIAVSLAPEARAAVGRYSRLAAPFLAAGEAARRAAAAERELDAISREFAASRRARAENARHAIVGRLAASISAELADPLGSLLGCAEILSDASDAHERSLVAEDVAAAGTRARAMIDQLAELCSLQADEEWRPFSPRPVLEESADLFAPSARRAGIRLERRIERELPEIEGDRELFRVGLTSALEALSGDPGRPAESLLLESHRAPSCLLVRIRREGRGGGSRTAGAAGGGRASIAWWISTEIFRALRGNVEWRTSGDGSGELTVAFPAVRSHVSAAAGVRPSREAEAALPSGRERIPVTNSTV